MPATPPDPPARSARPVSVAALTCGRCGGPFQDGAERCPWCDAGIPLERRGRSALCPRCSQRAPVGASWCPGCGERLAPQALAPVAAGRGCPRCRSPLRQRESGARSVTECTSCGGLWLTSSVLEELCAEAERAALLHAGPVAAPPVEREAKPGYLPCAGCGEPMQRRNFGGSSGVVVDVCREHGVWLDARELERVLAWARSGGPERERTRRVERARRALDERPAPLLPVDPEPCSAPNLLDVLGRVLGL
jgi:Zn-finger nucleic acid-binding protein